MPVFFSPARGRSPAPTRGDGLLEGLLAHWRMQAVLGAFHPGLRGAEILDIGCGSYPRFLLEAPFRRKVGIDPSFRNPEAPFPSPESVLETAPDPASALEIIPLRLEGDMRLPFPDGSFSCVTSLAVIEHLEPAGLPSLMAEIHRVLKPGGQAVLTTPHAFADGILRGMARLGLVSREEIEEHKSLFFRAHIRGLLRGGGFPEGRIRVGGFLMGLNILAVAEK